jgi:23S rRNA (adenine2503-C2)-methyltransferase
MPPHSTLPALTGLTKEQLVSHLTENGQPTYRADQILDWVWKKRPDSIEEMSNLPLSLRDHLIENFILNPLSTTRNLDALDTTRKLLFKLHDSRYVESVLIPSNPALYGESADRRTLCVSSQVGCAYGCKFCASGLAGFTRNLEASEITSQILFAEKISGERVDNLVFMGMGEPLANLKNLLQAIEIITSPWGINLGARHLTISTSGLVPQIKELAEHPRQIRLAISLHGATDDVRNQIMPINKKYPIIELMDALHHWNSIKKQHLTLEYILIENVNDSLEQARILAKHANKLRAKVNLIPYNTVEGLTWKRPSAEHCHAFRNILRKANVTATLRLEKGHDIEAACGQLRLIKETEDGILEPAPMKEVAS